MLPQTLSAFFQEHDITLLIITLSSQMDIHLLKSMVMHVSLYCFYQTQLKQAIAHSVFINAFSNIYS